MNNKLLFGLVTGLFVVSYPSALRQAHADTEDARTTDATRVDTLSKQFDVSPDTVQGLRNKEQGWGEITTELAMSRKLSKMDPKLYPTMNDALAKIEAQRADHMGWGKIAKVDGFKLGPVVREAHNARRELHETPAEERSESIREEKAEKHEGREGGQERLQREHVDRGDHSRVERPQAIENGKH